MCIRMLWWWATAFALFFIAGCAQLTSAPGTFDSRTPQWSGRLFVKVHSDPVQTLSAQFELQGSVENGSLVLTSTLGTTLGRIQWTPEEATLQVGVQVQRFDSLNALTRHLTGTERGHLICLALTARLSLTLPDAGVISTTRSAGCENVPAAAFTA